MINSQELLCVVNEYDVPLKPEPRHKVFKKGLWRRTVHVWIVNDKKQILCQRRSILKDSSPGMWEPSVAGHIAPNDNYFSGAVRDTRKKCFFSLVKMNNVDPAGIEPATYFTSKSRSAK